MTKKERQQIVTYIDAKVAYAIETLKGEFQTSTTGRSVRAIDVDDAREMLLTGRAPKKLLKKRAPRQKRDPRTYAPGDQQWENPAQRSE